VIVRRQSTPVHRMKRAASIAIFIVLAGLVLLGLFAYRTENGWTCSRTGSRRSNTTWLGFPMKRRFEVSPLQRWMEAHDMAVEHDWVRTMGTRHGLFSLAHGHARAPAVYHFSHPLQERFIETATEAEIRALIETLRDATRETQEQAIREIMEKALDTGLDKMWRPPPRE